MVSMQWSEGEKDRQQNHLLEPLESIVGDAVLRGSGLEVLDQRREDGLEVSALGGRHCEGRRRTGMRCWKEDGVRQRTRVNG